MTLTATRTATGTRIRTLTLTLTLTPVASKKVSMHRDLMVSWVQGSGRVGASSRFTDFRLGLGAEHGQRCILA